jgi:hypothetical protein
MVSPIEFRVDIYPKVSDRGFGSANMLGAMYRVKVVDAIDWLASFSRISAAVGECHKFALLGVSSQAVAV